MDPYEVIKKQQHLINELLRTSRNNVETYEVQAWEIERDVTELLSKVPEKKDVF